MKNPLVSVVMATYNYARYIGEAIESFLAQTYDNFELIIVDDGSTDHTLEVVGRYPDDRIVLIRREESSCSAVAPLNDGMAVARGDLIAVSGSDDLNVLERLALQVDFLTRHPEVDILGGALIPVDEVGEKVGRTVRKPVYEDPGQYRRELLAGKTVLHHATMMHRRSILEKLGGYGGFMSSGDTEFLMRASRYFTFCNLREVLVYCRQHPNSVTRTHGARLKSYHHRIFLEREMVWAQRRAEQLLQD